MADVGERAQVLLMAALGMAILFVALALILNTAIYTENLATRGSEIAGGGDAVRYLDTAREGIGGTIAYVNSHNNSGHDTLQRNLSTAVLDWGDASGRQFAHRGQMADVSLEGTTNGTRIAQDDGTRNFTAATGSQDWTLAEDVNVTRSFKINASRDLLDGLLDSPFRAVVDDGVRTWRMNVSAEGTDDIVIGIKNGTDGEETCRVTADHVWINVTGGTIDGASCDALSFGDGVGTPYQISFQNTDNIEGTYTLIVDNESLATSPGPHLHDDTAGSDPYAAPAIYSANFSMTYQTPRLFYNASIRVAPGETDD